MHIRKPRRTGREEIVSAGGRPAREVNLSRLLLTSGDVETVGFAEQESILVLVQGRVRFECDGQSWQASRSSPFQERASALYVPKAAQAQVQALAESELILASTRCTEEAEPAFLGPREVQVNARGKDAYQREVHDIFVSDSLARRLLLGETFNPAGKWSSFPPHKHDGEDGEPYLEEVYYYRIDPPQGFGFQALYSTDGTLRESYLVRDGDAVLISRGYHPVAAAPGYRLYYLWVLAGERRRLSFFEDPAHRWVHEQGK